MGLDVVGNIALGVDEQVAGNEHNLFVRPATGMEQGTRIRRDSYSLLSWQANGLEYWAVSDIEPGDLERFASAYRQAAR